MDKIIVSKVARIDKPSYSVSLPYLQYTRLF